MNEVGRGGGGYLAGMREIWNNTCCKNFN